MERKPCVFVSFRGQLQLLNCVSRVSEGSELPVVRGSHVRPPSIERLAAKRLKHLTRTLELLSPLERDVALAVADTDFPDLHVSSS